MILRIPCQQEQQTASCAQLGSWPTAMAGLPIKLLIKTPGRRTEQMESQNLDQFFVLPYTYLHINVYIHLATPVKLWASFDSSWSVKRQQNQYSKHTWRQENTQQSSISTPSLHTAGNFSKATPVKRLSSPREQSVAPAQRSSWQIAHNTFYYVL